ncbi:HD domain-containing protein [Sodiomyces alkalinus F11]|uniref:HD domain-containing protein n=1 Tax=Sodiomyces alkalinus (strain CBS 110278 / VKM F-3762 / F11) TaxID=1314773 RepID=A0A3N2PT26_SODAK|nr:HD domain-containing protein [Sodiomyces alkalinus F11]ROT37675.1 HD domain-containing protein [Sodiomyces alkalinus F11]
MDPFETFADDVLVLKARAYSEAYMSQYDASHDWSHIQRVVALAHKIYIATAPSHSTLSLRKVTLAALLHDVGDRKYVKPSQDAATLVRDFLVGAGADESLADDVQAICLGVSYAAEMRDPARTAALITTHPELAVVQDADRLDAIGAVGIGRCFAYGAAKAAQRGLQGSVDHFGEKLLRLEGMMKTQVGRELARERTERLRLFEAWWQEENAAVNVPRVG